MVLIKNRDIIKEIKYKRGQLMKQALYILAVIFAMGLCILDTNQNIKNSDELQSKLEQDTYTVYVNGGRG